MTFVGKTVLVTGGSRGIGRAVAQRFARDGARVIIAHRHDGVEAAATLATLATPAATAHVQIACDLADATERDALCATIASHGVDILVNNAGFQLEAPADHFDEATFDAVMSVNLKAAVALSAAAIKHFNSRTGGGVIINTTSVHALIPKPGYVSYATSKAGLEMLTRTLALETAGTGIRVNAVGPGAIRTPMNDSWRHDPTKRSAIDAHIPMGFSADPDDIAGVYTFLASDDARYITGQTIYACGGLTLYGDFKSNWSS